ncbi:Retrovirus-related Pol polyprotein, partial [Mucuna pruriens]
MEVEAKPISQQQRRMNLTILDVIKKEVTKLLVVGIIYPISDSQWGSLVQVVPKKSRMTVMKNQHDELNNWRVCIDYRRLNQATHKDHFPLPFIDQVLEKLAGKSNYYFLDGFSGYMQIYIALKISTRPPSPAHLVPLRTFACHLAYAMPRECMEVFMDDFTVYADSFDTCLENLSKVLMRCIDTNLVLNFEKCHFMVTGGIVLGHLVSNKGIELINQRLTSSPRFQTPLLCRKFTHS